MKNINQFKIMDLIFAGKCSTCDQVIPEGGLAAYRSGWFDDNGRSLVIHWTCLPQGVQATIKEHISQSTNTTQITVCVPPYKYMIDRNALSHIRFIIEIGLQTDEQ